MHPCSQVTRCEPRPAFRRTRLGSLSLSICLPRSNDRPWRPAEQATPRKTNRLYPVPLQLRRPRIPVKHAFRGEPKGPCREEKRQNVPGKGESLETRPCWLSLAFVSRADAAKKKEKKPSTSGLDVPASMPMLRAPSLSRLAPWSCHVLEWLYGCFICLLRICFCRGASSMVLRARVRCVRAPGRHLTVSVGGTRAMPTPALRLPGPWASPAPWPASTLPWARRR